MSVTEDRLEGVVALLGACLCDVTDPEVREAILRATWEVEAARRGLAPPPESDAARVVRLAFEPPKPEPVAPFRPLAGRRPVTSTIPRRTFAAQRAHPVHGRPVDAGPKPPDFPSDVGSGPQRPRRRMTA